MPVSVVCSRAGMELAPTAPPLKSAGGLLGGLGRLRQAVQASVLIGGELKGFLVNWVSQGR
jgi:hypothetical protein